MCPGTARAKPETHDSKLDKRRKTKDERRLTFVFRPLSGSEHSMIIIINGPLGIGKTQTSWALVRRFPRAVMLDADYVAEFHPFDYYNDEHLAYAHATMRVMVAH